MRREVLGGCAAGKDEPAARPVSGGRGTQVVARGDSAHVNDAGGPGKRRSEGGHEGACAERSGRVGGARRWMAMTDLGRTALLAAGKATVGLWVWGTRAGEPGLAGAARAEYDDLAGQAGWPSKGNGSMLAMFALPPAAIYRVLLRRGWTQEDAVEALTRAGATLGRRWRTLLRLPVRLEPMRRSIMEERGSFRGPEWEVEYLEVSDQRVAYDVRRCYLLDASAALGAAPATKAFCAVDTGLRENLCPGWRFSRAGTLADGADRCDFRYEKVA